MTVRRADGIAAAYAARMSLRSVLWCSLLVGASLGAQSGTGARSAPAEPGSLEHASPGYEGCDEALIAEARAVVADAVAAGEALGAVAMVVQGRVIVLDEAFGHRDAARTRPMQKDTLFRMASNTKAVTAAAILALVADGAIALDDPVATWLPTFAAGDAAKITVEHLLTHTSGLRIPTLFVEPLMQPSAEHPDAPTLVLEASRFGEIGPRAEPGTTYAYNNPGYNTLAAIVEVASGQPFADFCRRRFYEPLGMRDTCHHETVADLARMSEVVAKAEDGSWRTEWAPGGPPTVPFVRGSGGLISTATDFARFCRLWLDHGRHGERELLPPELVRLATTNRIPHVEGARYGFGWVAEPDGSFSHGGSDGTWAFCDPQRDLVGLVFTQTQGEGMEAVRRAFRERVEAACPAK